MKIKGTAFITRKKFIINNFGERKWNSFIAKVREKEPYFNNTILTINHIPAEKFLFFQEQFVKEFYNNNENVYWTLGEESANWALTEGPYAPYLNSRDLNHFVVNKLPLIWKSYFTEGELKGKIKGDKVIIKIKGITVKHIYFEKLIMGYVKRSLELFLNKNVTYKKIKGIFDKGKEVIYEFYI